MGRFLPVLTKIGSLARWDLTERFGVILEIPGTSVSCVELLARVDFFLEGLNLLGRAWIGIFFIQVVVGLASSPHRLVVIKLVIEAKQVINRAFRRQTLFLLRVLSAFKTDIADVLLNHSLCLANGQTHLRVWAPYGLLSAQVRCFHCEQFYFY